MEQLSSLGWEIKNLSTDESGTFTGLVSAYDVVDESDEIVCKGAFTETLRQKGPTRPLLWSHQVTDVIGTATCSDSPEGLRIAGKFNLDVGRAQEVYSLVKSGAVRGLSVGFKTIRDAWQNGRRHLKELALYECSLTPFPCNPAALVGAVKTSVDTAETSRDQRIARLLDQISKNFKEGGAL